MLILDAFNLLHAWRAASAPGVPRGVPHLLAALAEGRYAGHEITIVCDGDAGTLAPQDQAMVTRLLSGSRVRRVLYAGPHREADDVIEDLLREAPDAARLIVVSSDRRLRAAAARVDATVIAARAFLADLETDQAKALARQQAGSDRRLDAAEVRVWLDYFNLDAAGERRATPPRSAEPPRPSARADAKRADAGKPPSAKQRGFLDVSPADDLASIDPRDLDMERWLREVPLPSSNPGARKTPRAR